MQFLNTWKLYFFDEEYTENSGNYKIILFCMEKLKELINLERDEEIIENYFLENLQLNMENIFKNPHVYITYAVFSKYIIPDMLNKNIEIALRCFGCAISELLYEKNYGMIYVNIYLLPIEYLIANKLNLSNPPYNKFLEIGPEKIDHLVFLKGTVIRVGSKKTKVEFGTYICSKCHKQLINRNEFICRCRNRQADLIVEKSIFSDFQEIIIQEVTQANPTTLNVILKNKNVGYVSPGEIISLVGYIKVREERDQSYKLIVEANNIMKENERVVKYEANQYSINEIEKLSKEKNLLGILIDTIFPSIVGNDNILMGLLYSIFGGSSKYTGNCHIRKDIHTLLIGDPGLGKSKMLLEIVNTISKSTYVCGTMATSAGLTVSLMQEDGDFIIDAGALVISDGGICAVDEFDKMQTAPILDVMDEQTVSIAKAGIVCEIPARTTIIAAANPKFGQFTKTENKKRKITQDIKFDKNIISKFDLVFILKDNENKLNENLFHKIKNEITDKGSLPENNNKITTDLLNKKVDTNIYYTQMINLSENDQLSDIDCSSNDVTPNERESDSSTDLDNFIKNINLGGEINDILSEIRTDMFFTRNVKHTYHRSTIINYIEYARKTIMPKLSEEAKDHIYNYYKNELMSKKCTLRELESLIRLTESNAKIYLRMTATVQDAEEAIKLYSSTLTGSNELLQEESEIIKNKKKKSFIDLLKEKGTVEFFESELKKIYEESNIKKPYDRLIYQLNETGVLIKKAKNLYKLIV